MRSPLSDARISILQHHADVVVRVCQPLLLSEIALVRVLAEELQQLLPLVRQCAGGLDDEGEEFVAVDAAYFVVLSVLSLAGPLSD